MSIYTEKIASEGWMAIALQDINRIPAVLYKLKDEDRFSEAGLELAVNHCSREDLLPVGSLSGAGPFLIALNSSFLINIAPLSFHQAKDAFESQL